MAAKSKRKRIATGLIVCIPFGRLEQVFHLDETRHDSVFACSARRAGFRGHVARIADCDYTGVGRRLVSHRASRYTLEMPSGKLVSVGGANAAKLERLAEPASEDEVALFVLERVTNEA
jgi:hypothetical protein